MATNNQDKEYQKKAAVSGSSTTNNSTWTYDDFKASESTAAADQQRQQLATQKPSDFTYNAYEKSDAVKQAEAMLQQLGSAPGAYQSAWQTQLNDTLNKILNREKFSYDLNGDALYQQYKDQYMMQGQQAMMDTMGQAAALTGGYGNSYAQTAGQQTYQGYLQQLNEVVPELYQIALDRYNREGDALYQQYGLYADRENQDYGRYRDSVSDYYTELDRLTNDARYQSETDYNRYMDAYNMAYGQHRDQVGDWQQALARADEEYWSQYNRDYGQYSDNRNLSYQQNRDQVADAQWQAEFDEAKRQYDQEYAFALQKYMDSKNTGSGGYVPQPYEEEEVEDAGNVSFNNEGYSDVLVKQAQASLGLEATGKWDAASAAAASKAGFGSLSEVINAATTGSGSFATTINKSTANTQSFLKGRMTLEEALAQGYTRESYEKMVEMWLSNKNFSDSEYLEIEKALGLL